MRLQRNVELGLVGAAVYRWSHHDHREVGGCGVYIMGVEASYGEERTEGKHGEDKDDGDWSLDGWCYTGGCIHVECVVMVLGLTLFCVEHVGSGVNRDVWAWAWQLCLASSVSLMGVGCGSSATSVTCWIVRDNRDLRKDAAFWSAAGSPTTWEIKEDFKEKYARGTCKSEPARGAGFGLKLVADYHRPSHLMKISSKDIKSKK